MQNPTKIFIYGSCVTRDAFNTPEAKQRFEIVEYIARSSLGSLATEPCIDNAILTKIQSNFQRRMVEYDMNKQLFTRIAQCQFDILLIDLIDERFDLLEVGANQILTYTNEYVSGGGMATSGRLIKNGSQEYISLWKQGVTKLFDALSKNGLINKVKINQITWMYPFQDINEHTKFTDERIVKNNNLLKLMYRELRMLFPESSFIVYSDSVLKADINHKWGLSPFHYIPELYQAMLDIIDVLVLGVKLIQNNDALDVRLDLSRNNPKNIEFAYYLLLNNVRVGQKWYSNQTKTSFQLQGNGIFQVNVFAKTKDSACMIISTSNQLTIDNNLKYNLVAWHKPVYKYPSVCSFTSENVIKDGIYSIALANHINLDILIDGLQRLCCDQDQIQRVLIVFGGEVTSRETKFAPFFSGVNLSNKLQIPSISISDPAFMINNNLSIGWYLGGEWYNDFNQLLTIVVNHIIKLTKSKPIIVGGSAGGFAALSLASTLEHADFVIGNPQIKVSNYYPRQVKDFLSSCFPSSIQKLENQGTNSVNFENRIQVIFDELNLKSDLSKYNILKSNRIIYLQNDTDEHHISRHAKLFIESQNLIPISENKLYSSENIIIYFGSWGIGHIAPSPNYIAEVINLFLSEKDINTICAKITSINCSI